MLGLSLFLGAAAIEAGLGFRLENSPNIVWHVYCVLCGLYGDNS